jgi:hypothetical protein
VSADRINDVFTHTEPQGTSLESMTPSVIWLDFFVRYTEGADPCGKPIDHCYRSSTPGLGGIVSRGVFSRIEKERPVTSAPNEVQKSLLENVLVQRHRAPLLRDA